MSYPKQQYVALCNTAEIDLLQAVSTFNVARCKEILSTDKESIHMKGWNQLTPLHQACLTGHLEITKLLIENGADPNDGNNFEETPLHYACRRGNVSVVHFLLNNGGNSKLRDKRGRNCMHFAAIGGSVVMLHYLGEYTDLPYDVPDLTGKNALCICCDHRHSAASAYLLRKSRVDPALSDLNGVTPLHIAAERGFGELAWIILEVGGCGLLHLQNKTGSTPYDISKAGKTDNHKSLYSFMKDHMNHDRHSKPKGPVFAHYFRLFFPFTFAGVVFSMSTLMNSHGGVFTIFMMALLVTYIVRQSHRIPHISRWPNPIFMSGFLTGILHCAIAQIIKVIPALWPCSGLMIYTTVLLTLCFYLFWYLLYSDPGIDNQSKLCPILDRPLTVMDIAEGRCSEFDYCVFTEKIHSDRTKYCRICEKPMVELDHHCLFLNTCIAKNNHREFIYLLLVVMLLQISFLVCVGQYLSRLLGTRDIVNDGLGDPLTPYMYHLFIIEPWLFTLSVLCLSCFIWQTTLVLSQLAVIMTGSTYYFSSKSKNCDQKHLSMRQKWQNLFRFFVRQGSIHSSSSRLLTRENIPLI